MTYIRKGCPCGYKYSTSLYGYVHDPIGAPLCVCPRCGGLAQDRQSKEWIQMKPFKRFFSIHPRATATGFFLGLLFMILSFSPMALVLNGILPSFLEPVISGLCLVLFFLSYPLAVYLLIRGKVNSDSFRKRYCASILRTRNPEYRALLEKTGPIYDEKIPGAAGCSKKSQAKIDKILATSDPLPLKLPTLPETIRNF